MHAVYQLMTDIDVCFVNSYLVFGNTIFSYNTIQDKPWVASVPKKDQLDAFNHCDRTPTHDRQTDRQRVKHGIYCIYVSHMQYCIVHSRHSISAVQLNCS